MKNSSKKEKATTQAVSVKCTGDATSGRTTASKGENPQDAEQLLNLAKVAKAMIEELEGKVEALQREVEERARKLASDRNHLQDAILALQDGRQKAQLQAEVAEEEVRRQRRAAGKQLEEEGGKTRAQVATPIFMRLATYMRRKVQEAAAGELQLLRLHNAGSIWRTWAQARFLQTCAGLVSAVHNVQLVSSQRLGDNFNHWAPSGVSAALMFHGTPKKNVASICRTGFDAARFGEIWFSEQADDSIMYSKKESSGSCKLFMFLAAVRGKKESHRRSTICRNQDALPLFLIEFSA